MAPARYSPRAGVAVSLSASARPLPGPASCARHPGLPVQLVSARRCRPACRALAPLASALVLAARRSGRRSAAARRRASAEDKDHNPNDGKKSQKGSGDLGKDIQGWFEKKKAQGTGGAGGAVVGGMLLGPLGAIVGANVGAKLGPAVTDLLRTFEGEGGDDQSGGGGGGGGSARAADEAVDKPRRPEARRAAAERKPAAPQPSVDSELEELVASRRTPGPVATMPEAPAPQAAAAAAAAEAPASEQVDLLKALQQGALSKRRKLEAEVAELYAKAEGALVAGDEAAARSYLESKATAQRALDRILEGQRRRRERLESEVEELYAKAERALSAGDEAAARDFLASWRGAKELLERECGSEGEP
ncbi:unnamed protein product [Prorocentrum cordatum]|uniref:Uncharacterized protein n=1 Tax=Prorocentrum cordatum TaxID=2364126 RepID=A0ABN9UL65_9DINO|nr:unnamed protein product [Polarella glacialis]